MEDVRTAAAPVISGAPYLVTSLMAGSQTTAAALITPSDKEILRSNKLKILGKRDEKIQMQNIQIATYLLKIKKKGHFFYTRSIKLVNPPPTTYITIL